MQARRDKTIDGVGYASVVAHRRKGRAADGARRPHAGGIRTRVRRRRGTKVRRRPRTGQDNRATGGAISSHRMSATVYRKAPASSMCHFTVNRRSVLARHCRPARGRLRERHRRLLRGGTTCHAAARESAKETKAVPMFAARRRQGRGGPGPAWHGDRRAATLWALWVAGSHARDGVATHRCCASTDVA